MLRLAVSYIKYMRKTTTSCSGFSVGKALKKNKLEVII